VAETEWVHNEVKQSPGRSSVRGIFMPIVKAVVNVRFHHDRARDRGQLFKSRRVRGGEIIRARSVRIAMEQAREVKRGKFRQARAYF